MLMQKSIPKDNNGDTPLQLAIRYVVVYKIMIN